jgi:hypothetical protein
MCPELMIIFSIAFSDSELTNFLMLPELRVTYSIMCSELILNYPTAFSELTINLSVMILESVRSYSTDPVAARSEARAFSPRTLNRGFESRLRHGCLSSSFCVVLFFVGRGLTMG